MPHMTRDKKEVLARQQQAHLLFPIDTELKGKLERAVSGRHTGAFPRDTFGLSVQDLSRISRSGRATVQQKEAIEKNIGSLDLVKN